jgi:hypothetical protein
MKSLVVVLFISFISATLKAQTSATFDKFKNTTHFMTQETRTGTVTYDGGKDASPLIHRMTMTVGFSCDGQVTACMPKTVELLFAASTSDWMMRGNNEVNLLIDGKPASAGKADWDGQVLDADSLVEYNDAQISPDLLEKLAAAKTVDVQIGLFEFSLTDANLAAFRDIAAHAGWVSDDLKKSIVANSEAGKSSPAAAAEFAQDGHIDTPEELSQLVQSGKASKTAVITIPAGAEVDIDGNRAGITPMAFVLIKRENPRVLTIKMAGYKTVEKKLIPDGKVIPLAITLEKEQ